MLRKLILAAAIASSVLAGGVAFAQAPQTPPAAGYNNGAPPSPSRAMMRADANHDGVVTRQEYMAEAERRFAKLDRNRDGKLDASEMAPRGGRGGGRRRGGGGDDMAPPPPPGNGYGE